MTDLPGPRAPKFSKVLQSSPTFSEVSKVLQRPPSFSKVLHRPPSTAMSAPEEEPRERHQVGSVRRRPSAEIVAEMSALAREDRAKMSTPFPPAPLPPGRFFIVRRPPLPRLPPVINPYVPPSPERAQRVEAAAIRARALEEAEAFLLAEADRDAARPRCPSPPRDPEDHFDLAKWNRRRWL